MRIRLHRQIEEDEYLARQVADERGVNAHNRAGKVTNQRAEERKKPCARVDNFFLSVVKRAAGRYLRSADVNRTSPPLVVKINVLPTYDKKHLRVIFSARVPDLSPLIAGRVLYTSRYARVTPGTESNLIEYVYMECIEISPGYSDAARIAIRRFI